MSLLFVSLLLIELFGLVKPDAQPRPLDSHFPFKLAPGLYVFGDSQGDVGLNTNLNTKVTANYMPYGTDFAIGATGRFSNGNIISDFLDHHLGLPVSPHYSTSKFISDEFTTGFSYASGFAGILQETGHAQGQNCSLSKQIAMFNKTVHENLPRNFNGTAELSEYLSKCIFLVLIGTSDYTHNYLQTSDYNTRETYLFDLFGSILVKKLGHGLKALYELGARRIVVFEIGPLGCYPTSVKTFKPQTKCVEDINQMVSTFNEKLHKKVESLRSRLINSTILIAKVYDLITDMISEPSSYGFEDSSNPCCQVKSDGLGLCIPNKDPCPNREATLFWDDHHLTEAANKIIAEKCFIDSSFCTPNSIHGIISSGQIRSPGFSHFLFVVIIAAFLGFRKF